MKITKKITTRKNSSSHTELIRKRKMQKKGTSIILMAGISTGRKIVVIKLPDDIPGILLKSLFFYEKMNGNELFYAVQQSMEGFKDLIEAAVELEAAMPGGGKQLTINRNSAVSKVIWEVYKLKDHVQALVTADLTHAKEIAISAGMDIRGYTKKAKQQWEAQYNGLSGEMDLTGEYIYERSAYEWQATLTPDDPLSWKSIDIDVTIKANTTVKGLPVGTMVYFRYRIIVSAGPKSWSNVIGRIII
jgi:hypothetical protein